MEFCFVKIGIYSLSFFICLENTFILSYNNLFVFAEIINLISVFLKSVVVCYFLLVFHFYKCSECYSERVDENCALWWWERSFCSTGKFLLFIMVEPFFDYQFRLILIGDSTVGKSSLLKSFTDGKFAEVSFSIFTICSSKISRILSV